MNRTSLFATMAAVCLLAACSPKISITVMKTYPPLNESDTVVLYHYGMDAPASAEVVAEITVKDGGMTTKCNYSDVIAIAKDETKRVGGDGLQVVNHLLPGTRGSSCHQIEALALRLNPVDSLQTDESERTLFGNYIKNLPNNLESFRQLSPYEVSVNIGYSKITNDTKDASFEDKISNCLSWDLQFLRYYKIGIGWGLMYSGYYASATYEGINNRFITTYIAPMFVGKAEFDKWVLKYKVGVGYYNVTDKASTYLGNLQLSKSMVGSNVNVGVDYKLSENFALGLEAGAVTGTFTEKENNEFVTYGDKRLDLKIGIRYYFGKKK